MLLDGQDLRDHTLISVRRHVGLAGPDFPLLRGTVARNLTYRHPDASEDEQTQVRWLCGIDEIVADLPDGADTKISEGGNSLSAGQRQRLSLARALLGDPPLLLLDEADANLDHRAAAVVDRVIRAHRGTVLVVTHRADRLAAADVVWHLRDGRLVGAGPPAVLLAGDGPTAALFSDAA